MKTNRTNIFLGMLRRFLATSSIVMSFFGLAQAADITWDVTPGTVGAGDSAITGGSGTWDVTNGNWTTDGGANNVAWVNANNDVAVFGGTGGTVALGAAITANGMTFGVTGYALTGSAITLAGTTPTITATADASIANIISGSAGLVKAGDGKLTLTGANNYTGGTTINGGTLQIGSSATNPTLGTGTYTINASNTLRIEYATTTTAATNLGSLTWGNFTGSGTLNIHANGIFDYMGNATALPAGFTGTLHVSGGRAQLAASSGGGLGGATKIIVGSGGHLGMWDNGINLPGSISFEIAGTGYGEGGYEVAVRMANGGGTTTINGPVLLTGSASLGAGGTGVINGIISGADTAPLSLGAGQLGGTMDFAGANTFAGTTTVNVGTLRLSNPLALQNSTLSGSAGTVTFNSSVGGNAFTLGGLEGSRNLTLQNTAGAAIELTIGANNANTTYSGVLSGSGSLVKSGTGEVALTGANTYAGTTTVSAGTLLLNPPVSTTLNGLGGAGTLVKDGTGILRISSGTYSGFTGDFGVLGGKLVTTGYHQFGTGANFILDAGATYAPSVLDDGNVPLEVTSISTPTLPDTATIDLSATQFTLSSAPTLANPVSVPLAVYSDASLGGGGVASLALLLPRNYTGTLVDDEGDSNIFAVKLTGFNPTLWTGLVDGNWDIDTTANWTGVPGDKYLDGDFVQFDDTASGTGTVAVTLGTAVVPGTVAFANASRALTLSGSGGIGGAAAIQKSGGATVTLGTNNTFTGTVTVGAGTLAAGHANALGSTAGGTTVASGAVLDLNGTSLAAEPLTVSGTGIASGGVLVNSAVGAASAASPITLAGATTITANNPMSLGGAITMGGDVLTLNGTSTLTVSGGISGTAGLVKDGTGTVAFSTQKVYTGNTTVNAGILDLTGGGGAGGTIRGAVTVNPGAVLRLSAGDVTGYGTGTDRLDTINLVGGTMTVNTASNQTLGVATINMTGATINGIAGSNLDFFNTGTNLNTFASATTSVVSGARIGMRQNDGVTFTVEDGGAAIDLDVQSQIYTNAAWTNNDLIKEGAGTMRISGLSSYTGGTIVNAGSFLTQVNQSSSFYQMAAGTTLGLSGVPGLSFTTGSLDLAAGTTAVNLTNFGSQSAAANAPIRVTGTLNAAGTTTIGVGGYFAGAGTYPLVSYPASYTGGAAPFTAVLPPNVTGTLVDNPTNLTIDLVISASDALVWNGGVNGDWDANTTANWFTNPAAPDGKYQEGMVVQFDDTATGTTAVNLAATLAPASTIFNNTAKNYTLGGTGVLSGSGPLMKFGAGSLTVTGSHSYTGGTTISAGTLQLGDGATNGVVQGDIVNNGALVVNNASDSGISGVVSGTGGLTKLGAGTFTLASASTCTGATLVGAGNLVVPSLASTSITTNATLTFNQVSASQVDASGAITGTGAVAYTGPAVAVSLLGQFLVSDANSYAGGTTVANARANITHALGFGTGPVTVSDGGQILLSGANMVLSNPLTINGMGWQEGQLLGAIRLTSNATIAGTVTLGSDSRISSYGGSGSISGAITGTGNLEFSGQSNGNVITLVGSAPNTYVGTTTMRSGSLILNKSTGPAITGNLVMDNAGVNPVIAVHAPSQFAIEPVLSFINTGNNGHFCLYGNTVTFRGISSAANGVVQNSQVVGGAGQTNVPATLVLNTPTGENYSFLGGYLRNQIGQLNVVKNGAGKQTVGGGTTIDYNGTTDINAGELHFYDMDDTQSRAITIASGATLRVEAVTRTFNGNVFNNATWSGGGNIVMSGAGIKQFNGNADTFIAMGSGTGIDLQAGILRLGYGGRFYSANNKADLNVAAGATFNLWDTPTANEVRFDALTGAGTVTRGYTPDTSTNSTGIGTFVVGMDNGSGTFSGVIADGVGNTGSILNLVKRGSGTQTLSGANTYRGTTTLNAGTLVLDGDGDLSGTSSITVSPGALLDASSKTTDFTQITGRSMTAGRVGTAATDIAGNFSTGGTINVAGWATAGTLSLDGNLSLTGGGALQIDLSSTAASGNDVIAVDGNLSLAGTTTVTPALINGVPDTSAPYAIVTYTGTLTGDQTNLASGLPANTRYAASFDTTTTPGSVLMNVTGTGEDLVWSAASGQTWLADTTTLNWSGDTKYFQNLDKVTFDDSTDGTGAVTVNLTSTVQPGGILVNNPTRAYTISGTNGVIGGGGSLTKRGAAGLTLSNANTFTGGMTVVDGTVTLTNVAAAGTGPITLSHPDTTAAIILKANVGSGNFANPINVSANGTGTVTIDQDNSLSYLSGTLTLNRPTTIEGGPDRTGISGKITGNVGTLTFSGVRTTLDNTVQSDFTGNIEVATGTALQTNAMVDCLPPTASVNVTGTGRFQLNNGHAQTINALTGGTTGTTGLQIIAGSATTLTVGAGGGSGTFNGNIVSALSLIKTGGGIQTLGGSNTYSGTTRILSGAIALTNSNALSGTTLVWDNEGGSLDFGTLTTAVIGNIRGAQNLNLASTSLTDLTIGSTSNGDHCTYTGTVSLPPGATFTKSGNGNLVLGGSTSSGWTGNTRIITTSTAPTLQASLHFAKTGGAKAVPANTIVQFGTGTTNQANLRMDQNDQFGANVLMAFGNASNQWTRLDLRGTTQTLAGVTSGNLSTLGSGIIQGRGLDSVSSGESTLILTGNEGDPNYPTGGYVFRGYIRDADSGANSLYRMHIVKNGTGTQVLAGDQMGNHSGTFTVNAGTLEITNGTAGNGNTAVATTTVNGGTLVFSGTDNTSAGTVRGTVNVNAGGTLRATKGNAFGWDGNRITTLNVNGGLVETTANGDQGWGITINMTGGELKATGSGYYSMGGGCAINVLASPSQAVINAPLRLREGNASNLLPFNVNDGAQDADLVVNGGLIYTGGTRERGISKNGAGTMTLAGVSTYDGNTVVNAGTLVLADNAQLKFVIGANSGTTNSISGAGTVQIDGDFVIDTAAAGALDSGSWVLENVASLTGAYGSSFSVVGFTDAGNDKWTKLVGNKAWTFDETTGTLSVELVTFNSWMGSFGLTGNDALPGADPDHDGIQNGTEMVLGGNPATGMDTALLPTIELVNADPDGDTTFADYLLFTYRRSDLAVSVGLTSDCATSTDLAAWTAATGAPGVVVLVDDNFAWTNPSATNTDRVRVYVPRGTNTKLFGRLNVVVP